MCGVKDFDPGDTKIPTNEAVCSLLNFYMDR